MEAGYERVILVGSNARHLKTLAKFVAENLDESDRGKVTYIAADEFPSYLDSLGPAASEQTVRGYKVRRVQQVLDPADVEARKSAIMGIIAGSLIRSKAKEN